VQAQARNYHGSGEQKGGANEALEEDEDV